jgi:hypothetical protein
MKVYINGMGGERRLVEAELIRENKATIIVRLPDGNVISRKKKRDLPEEKGRDGDL